MSSIICHRTLSRRQVRDANKFICHISYVNKLIAFLETLLKSVSSNLVLEHRN